MRSVDGAEQRESRTGAQHRRAAKPLLFHLDCVEFKIEHYFYLVIDSNYHSSSILLGTCVNIY